MKIDFARSERSTVGIEWEIALVDRETGELASVAEEVLAALEGDDGSPHPQVTNELLLNTVELVSGVHHTVADAVADVARQLDEVRTITDALGVDPMCSGSHPFGQWFDQKVTNKPRYLRLIDRTQWWGRNMMIWGFHVHVGIEDRDKVIPILNGLLTYLPHLQALSASSPFWAGVDTGYASNRALMFQQLPTAGIPWQLADWSEWEGYVADMTTTGVIEDERLRCGYATECRRRRNSAPSRRSSTAWWSGCRPGWTPAKRCRRCSRGTCGKTNGGRPDTGWMRGSSWIRPATSDW
jgi:carboxylate-amine ligase